MGSYALSGKLGCDLMFKEVKIKFLFSNMLLKIKEHTN